MNGEEPRQCERCGDVISNGAEKGPVGDYLFLCDVCFRKLTRPARPVEKLKIYEPNIFVNELLARRSQKGNQ